MKFNMGNKDDAGLHIIGRIYTVNTQFLKKFEEVRRRISKIIKKHRLKELGSFYYQFPGGGFTGVVSLAESHIAIHTWPEFQYLTLDVYLCNFSRNNNKNCRDVFKEISKIFNTVKIKKKIIKD